MFEHTFFFVLFLAHHIRWIFGFSFDVKNLFRHKSARLDPNYSLEGQTSNSKKCPKDFGAAISAIHTVVFKDKKLNNNFQKHIWPNNWRTISLTDTLLPNEMTRLSYYEEFLMKS